MKIPIGPLVVLSCVTILGWIALDATITGDSGYAAVCGLTIAAICIIERLINPKLPPFWRRVFEQDDDDDF